MHVIFSSFLPVGIVMFEHKTFGAAKGKKLTHGREQSSLIVLSLGHIVTIDFVVELERITAILS